MKTRWLTTLAALSTLALLLGTGCGAKEEETTAAATEAPAAEAAPAEETAAAPAEESTTDSLVIQPMDVGETLASTDQAAKNKDWEKATDNLLKLQMSGSLKNDAESWQYNRRMTVLQQQLLEAADSGDPKAQAAIDLLRRSRRVH